MKLDSRFWLLAMAVPVLLAVGCNNGSAPAPGVDSVTINSISPSIVSAGTTTTFTITVSYNLRSRQSGVINCSFQSGSSDFDLEKYAQPVTHGSGTVSIVVPKTLLESNTVRVLLSEYPHPMPWSPLVQSRQTITVNSSDSRTAQRSSRRFLAGRFSPPSRR